LQRLAKQRAPRLTPAQSDRLYRLARLVALAEEVFEDRERAHSWLRQAQRGLGGRVPLELMRTEVGAREIEDLLGRIEYGVFS
jgi:putative toxin-antitoxin system antitoxin component (TIGR02293 family)